MLLVFFLFFFFNDTATTEIYTLSLHDALPISAEFGFLLRDPEVQGGEASGRVGTTVPAIASVIRGGAADRAGLEAGDVILQINEQPVLSRDGAREALADASPERPL